MQVKAVEDTNSWRSLVSVVALHTQPVPSDAIGLGPASPPDSSLDSSILGSESCVLRGVSENVLGQVLTLNQDGSRRLNCTGYTRLSSYPQPVSEKGGMAVPREKTTKITVTPESFLVSWHSWLLLPLGNGLAFG